MDDRFAEALLYLGGAVGCMAAIYASGVISVPRQTKPISDLQKYRSANQVSIEGTVLGAQNQTIIKKETSSYYDKDSNTYFAINPFRSRRDIILQYFST